MDNEILTPKNKKSKKLVIVVIITLFLTVVAYATWWYLNKTSDISDNKSDSKVIKKLTIALTDGPLDSFFPGSDYHTSEYQYAIENQVSEGLVAYEDITKIVPRLAISWNNPDENTWVFNLKKNVKFHTGRTMTADDVVYSIEKSRGFEEMETYNSTIQSVKVLSSYKVEIKTNEPDAVLLNKLVFLPIIDSKGKDSNTLSAGTGPYILKKGTKPTEKSLELVAFDQYHGGKVMTRALKFYLVSSQEDAVKDVKNGKANLGGELLSESTPGLDKNDVIFNTPGNTVSFILMNTLKPDSPLAKKEVREAIRYAVNKEKLLEASGFKGKPISQLVTKSIPGYNPNIPEDKVDIAKAKELLTSAGYKDGVDLDIYYYKTGNEKMIAELKKQLSEVGIRIKDITKDDIGSLIDSITSGENDLATIGYESDTYDALDAYDSMTRGLNQYKSSQLDEYLDSASKTFDPNKRLSILQSAAKYISSEAIVIPLYNRSYFWILDSNNYYIKRDMPAVSTGVYFWKVHYK